MGLHRFVETNDPTQDYTEKIVVESATAERPEKVMHRGGPAVELDDDQVAKISRYAVIEKVSEKEAAAEASIVDQPGIGEVSTSTNVPPDPGRAQDYDSMRRDDLVEIAQQRGIDGASSMNKQDIIDVLTANDQNQGV